MEPQAPQMETAATPPPKKKASRRRGIVLVAVLVVVASLSLAAYHYSYSMTSEYKASQNSYRTVQARSFAASGVHYAAAVMSDPDSFNSFLNGNYWNNIPAFQNVFVQGEGNLKGRFSIIAPPSLDDGSDITMPMFGVSDEGGK